MHELSLAVVLRVDLGVRAQDRARSEGEVDARGRVHHRASRTVAQVVVVEAGGLPNRGHVGEGHEEVVRQNAHGVA